MEYEVPSYLTFDDVGEFIKNILCQYEKGKVELSDIMEYSENLEDHLWHKYGDPENPIFPNFVENDFRSILCEVIEYMRGINIDIAYHGDLRSFAMLPCDVPHFIEFLDTPRGKEKEGWAKIRKYIAGLKLEDRIEEEKKQGMHRQ